MERRVFIPLMQPFIYTPVGGALGGIAGGLAGTIVLSLLSRVVPGMRERIPPHIHSPIARALTGPLPPGPEGIAQQFAFKLMAGMFGKDTSRAAKLSGILVHAVYGSSWGALYGMFAATFHPNQWIAGPIFGLIVWLIGPVWLVPAMRLMRPVPEEPPVRTGMMIGGHLAYGLVVALAFHWIERGGL